jgi:hypothetical protein
VSRVEREKGRKGERGKRGKRRTTAFLIPSVFLKISNTASEIQFFPYL